MKVRGIKQFFHWLFLAVGIFSLIMLGITVDTYISYAQEGYGLEMNFDQASLNENRLALRFYFENPGGLDVEIKGGNVTLGEQYQIPMSAMPTGTLSPVPAGENTSVVIWVTITDPDLEEVRMSKMADVSIELELWVPERYLTTHMTFQAELEVSA